MRLTYFIITLACATKSLLALSPAGWRAQSIYQVLTDRFARTDGSTTAACNTGSQIYCGGSWQGIINHLDYVQNMGFTAIWISPVVENLPQNTGDGEGYHGYWAQNIYALNSNFGTASDLAALSAALHARGMYLMVDVVTNHMGYAGCGTCVDYSVFNPFNSQSYYHPFCLIDYNNATSIKVCWEGDNIVSLPDLRTEDSGVLSIWETWITQLVSNYTIDGIRLDSAQQVDTVFFQPFQSAAGGIHILGEVFNGDPAYVCPYQNYLSGLLNYPAYYWITQAFETTSGSISNLVNGINTIKSDCADTTLLGSFMENHDVPRFASYTSDISLAKNAIAFTILADGTPIIYAGQEQHFSGGNTPYEREATWLSGYNTGATLYGWIASLNQIRNQAIYKDSSYLTYKASPVYSDGSTIVMRKGNAGYQIIGVFSNLGSGGNSYTLTLTASETGFSASQAVVEVMGCTSYTTDSSGNLAVAMSGGVPRVFYPKAQLAGSGICSSITGSTSSTAATTSSPNTSASASASISTTKVTSTSTSTTKTTSKSTSTSVSKTSSACAAATSVAVTFNELKTTTYGQTIKIVGNTGVLGNWNTGVLGNWNTGVLGNWNTGAAIALSASSYTSSNPLWSGTITFAAGQVIQYKYIDVDSGGAVTWEADPNHTYTVPAGCATATSVSNTWQS